MNFTEASDNTCSSVDVAARLGDLESLQDLVGHGIFNKPHTGKPVDVRDAQGWTPIHEAAFHGNRGCLEFLLRQEVVDPDWQNLEGETALLLAARFRCRSDCLKTLLEYEANPNLASNEGYTPIWEAVKANNLDSVRLLTTKDANVNCRMHTGYTPLHLAAERNYSGILQYLIDHGANIGTTFNYDLTPLFLTAQSGCIDCLKILLKTAEQRGQTDLMNKTALDGASPVMIAAQEGHEECISLLLEHGADVNIPVKGSHAVAAHYAIYKNNPRCLQMILPLTNSDAFTVNVNVLMHPLILALKFEDTTCLEILIAAGLNFKKHLPILQDHFVGTLFFSRLQYKTSASVLCRVGYKSPLEGVEVLLRAGLECNPQDDRELPPLLAALSKGAFELYILLIKYGARPNIYHELMGGNLAMLLAIKNDLLVRAITKRNRKIVGKYICPLLLAGGEAHSCFNSLYGVTSEYNLYSILSQCQLTNWYRLLLILMCLSCNIHLEKKLYKITKKYRSHGLLQQIQESSSSLAHACRKQIVLQFARHGNYSKEVIEALPIPVALQEYLLFLEYGIPVWHIISDALNHFLNNV